MPIRLKRGLEANRTSVTPDVGEPLFTTDTKQLYVGDGITPGGVPVDTTGVGAIASVNGQTGVVVLDQDDIGDGATNKAYTVTEQTKLSGIETAATADQTASEILTAIKTVDGTGSGLDADTLDGYEATAFAPALGLNDNYVTDAEKTVIGNTSGTNTGDNATNSQYSGLAASKQDTLISGTNIKTVNSTSLLGSGDIVIVGGGAVDSVNTQTGVVVLDADDIADTATTHKFVTAADITKLGNLSGTNTGNQTSIVGITGTTAQFNTALTDGDFATLAGAETLTSKVVTNVATSAPASPAAGMLWWDTDDVSSPGGNVTTDNIGEITAAHGVIIDGLTIKDNAVVSVRSTDAAGWTVDSTESKRRWHKKGTVTSVTLTGNAWGSFGSIALPTGMSTVGNNFVAATANNSDNAISVTIVGASSGATAISFQCWNHYGGTITNSTISYSVTITEA